MVSNAILLYRREGTNTTKITVRVFGAEKRTAQLSTHPHLYLRAQEIMQAAMVEIMTDYNKVHKDVARLIYLYLDKNEFFFDFSLLRKRGSPCLSRGSLSY